MNKIALSALAAAALLSGCASKYQLQANEPAQASDVDIVIKKNKTGAYEVKLGMEHLPPPDRLGDDYEAYAAWFVSEGAAPVKAGNVDFDEKKREGELIATTPSREFTLLVTLEKDADATSPSSDAVIDKRVKGPR